MGVFVKIAVAAEQFSKHEGYRQVLGLFCVVIVFMSLTSINAAPAPFIDLGTVLLGGATVGTAGALTINAGALAIPAAPLLLAKAILAGKTVALASIAANGLGNDSPTRNPRRQNLNRGIFG